MAVDNMLRHGVEWLDGQRAAHMSDEVTYQRGGDTAEIAAMQASTPMEVTDEAGLAIRTQGTDFVVGVDSLVLAGVRTVPQVGDRILVPAGEKVVVYEVLALPGGQHYRTDCTGTMFWIHAKQVGQEDV